MNINHSGNNPDGSLMVDHLWSLVRSSFCKRGARLECYIACCNCAFSIFGFCSLSSNSKPRDEHTNKITHTHAHTSTIQWRSVAIVAYDDDANCGGGIVNIEINIMHNNIKWRISSYKGPGPKGGKTPQIRVLCPKLHSFNLFN